MSNYYEKRDAKVNIALELMARGWEVYGYKKDESDGMTDYYSPANWDGIAEKNGYILVVDCKYSSEGQDITRYNPNYISISVSDKNKIESLKKMTIENGATEGEEQNAKNLINKINAKYKNEGVSQYEVIGHIPAHMGNPNRVMWHIEKDGALVDKGNKLTIYADIPDRYRFDINTMQFYDSYKIERFWNREICDYEDRERTLPERELKAVNEFKALILRLERAVNGMNSCGDGTKETEEAYQQQKENEKMVKKTFTKVKKVIKPVKVERDFVKIGDIVNYKGNRKTYCYWKVTYINEERKTFSYEQVGKKYQDLKNPKRYYNYLSKLDQYDIFELKEVEEVETIEKWVREKTKTNKNETVKTKQEQPVQQNLTYTIEESEHTKTGEKIFLVRFNEKLSKEEYIRVNKKIKSLGGWYSRFTRSFIFKEDPTDILKENFNNTVENEQENCNSEKIQSMCNYIVDNSSDIITDMKLSKTDYWNNAEYKEKLLEVIKKVNINKTIINKVIKALEVHKEYKNYINLIEVLKGFYQERNSSVNTNNDKEKLLSKIDKQIESNNRKIERLNGDYLTNTWKRMREQENRDNQRHGYEIDNNILNIIKEKILINNISGFEIALITRTLRDDFKSYYKTYNNNIKYNRENSDLYPSINPNWDINSDWVKSQTKRIKRLENIKLFNDRQLKNTLKNDYEELLNLINKDNTELEKQEKIKSLEREYKMQQKGDINFTPKKLVNILIDYADIKESDIILEPTAGIGNIADEISNINNNVDCIEYMHNYNELLKLKGYNVIENDFMKCNKKDYYTRIIANFPFSKEQEMIKHAYNLLKEDGKIVCITSNHWTFANDKNSINFREWLNNLDYEVYESNIKFEFTNVNYKILVINKDENLNSVAI
ncbi:MULTISPECIES: hypothetical protein [unclassified Clostridium]|uniref:hypothetical protein n=1 Tax=unclassified Clostridium TaxID=2614128 RepID=UPI002079E810|nr:MULTISPECIES: hypothetical protein [unclassified Clostridium]